MDGAVVNLVPSVWVLLLTDAHAQALQGPIVFSILDLNELETPQSLENIVAEGRIRSDWRKQVFPTGQCRPPVGFEGNPSGTFRVMVCKLALGAVLSKEQQHGDGGKPEQEKLRWTGRRLLVSPLSACRSSFLQHGVE